MCVCVCDTFSIILLALWSISSMAVNSVSCFVFVRYTFFMVWRAWWITSSVAAHFTFFLFSRFIFLPCLHCGQLLQWMYALLPVLFHLFHVSYFLQCGAAIGGHLLLWLPTLLPGLFHVSLVCLL